MHCEGNIYLVLQNAKLRVGINWCLSNKHVFCMVKNVGSN